MNTLRWVRSSPMLLAPGCLAALSLFWGGTMTSVHAQDFGTLVLVAGSANGKLDNGIAATAAALPAAFALAVDPAGNLFISENTAAGSGNRIRRVDAVTQTIQDYAGSGKRCDATLSCGLGGPALSASMDKPTWMATDGEGNLYVVDGFLSQQWVRQVRAADGAYVHIAGGGKQPVGTGQCPSAIYSTFGVSGGLAVGPKGDLYIAGTTVLRVDPEGAISSVAGNGGAAGIGDGGPAAQALIPGGRVYGIAADAQGNLFISDGPRVRRIDAGADGVVTGADDEIITTVVGTGKAGAAVDFVTAKSADLNRPSELLFDSRGDLFILDVGVGRVRKVSAGADKLITGADDEMITTVAGGGLKRPDNGVAATDAQLALGLSGIALDGKGDLLLIHAGAFVFKVIGGAAGALPLARGPGSPRGDLDGDGRVGIQDVLLSLRFIVELTKPVEPQLFAADANRDGKMNVLDTIQLLMVAAGLRKPCF